MKPLMFWHCLWMLEQEQPGKALASSLQGGIWLATMRDSAGFYFEFIVSGYVTGGLYALISLLSTLGPTSLREKQVCKSFK